MHWFCIIYAPFQYFYFQKTTFTTPLGYCMNLLLLTSICEVLKTSQRLLLAWQLVGALRLALSTVVTPPEKRVNLVLKEWNTMKRQITNSSSQSSLLWKGSSNQNDLIMVWMRNGDAKRGLNSTVVKCNKRSGHQITLMVQPQQVPLFKSLISEAEFQWLGPLSSPASCTSLRPAACLVDPLEDCPILHLASHRLSDRMRTPVSEGMNRANGGQGSAKTEVADFRYRGKWHFQSK